jgi:hypothetical protein
MIPNQVIVLQDRALTDDEIAAARAYIDLHAKTEGTGGLMGQVIALPFPAPFARIIPWMRRMLLEQMGNDDMAALVAAGMGGDAITLKLLPGMEIRRHNHNDTPAIGLYYFSGGARLNWQHRWRHHGIVEPMCVDIRAGQLVLMDGELEHWVDKQPEPEARYAIAVVWRTEAK